MKCIIDWDRFREYCFSRFSPYHAQQMFNNALKYYRLLDDGFDLLHTFSKDKCRHVLSALANLSKFCGCYDRFKLLKEKSGLKWGHENSFEAFLRIYKSNNDALKWALRLKESIPYYYYFPICFLALTGLRPIEAINSLNLVSAKGLEDYYNPEVGVLEHFRFPSVFLRGTKNAFISIISDSLLEKLGKWHYSITYNMLRLALKRRNYNLQLQELRIYYATYLRQKGIPKESIDFIQGRISKDVFVRFYYKPHIIQLKKQVLEVIAQLEDQLL
ncbi:MAG: integrase [Nitrososphaeria archaeon]